MKRKPVLDEDGVEVIAPEDRCEHVFRDHSGDYRCSKRKGHGGRSTGKYAKHLCLDDCWVAWTSFFSVNKEELARTAGSLVHSGD